MGYWNSQILFLICLFHPSFQWVFVSCILGLCWVHIFIIVISSWWMDSFIIIKCSLLFLSIFCIPKCILSVKPLQHCYGWCVNDRSFSILLLWTYLYLWVHSMSSVDSTSSYGPWVFKFSLTISAFSWDCFIHSNYVIFDMPGFMFSSLLFVLSFVFLHSSFTAFFYIKWIWIQHINYLNHYFTMFLSYILGNCSSASNKHRSRMYFTFILT